MDLRIEDVRYHRHLSFAMIASGKDPSREDLDGALDEIPGEPIPRALIDYVRRVYIRASAPRRPGPPRQQRTRDIGLCLYYRRTIASLCEAEQTREVKGKAVARTAEKFRLSPKQVRRILKNPPEEFQWIKPFDVLDIADKIFTPDEPKGT